MLDREQKFVGEDADELKLGVPQRVSSSTRLATISVVPFSLALSLVLTLTKKLHKKPAWTVDLSSLLPPIHPFPTRPRRIRLRAQPYLKGPPARLRDRPPIRTVIMVRRPEAPHSKVERSS